MNLQHRLPGSCQTATRHCCIAVRASPARRIQSHFHPIHCCSNHGSHGEPSNHDTNSSSHSSHDSARNSHGSPNSHSQDDVLDVVSMFDVEDSSTISYQPSSEQYYKHPGRPTNSDFWAYKPVWCQPWSILASGTAFVAGARWLCGGSNIATGVAAVPILVWWYLFLVLVPADFRKYAEEK